ncbi:sarcosine oxidase subunit delta [Caulobacter sp. CCUG 60055]|uniref:sarcosine oxidase subunit delta n=1 Tax=Caulobacter sp. CCUG 60055 TaxID=2100090 RepID=UPI001FA75127|nr:sarcosine oxidase subunit delta [Caulobacter sp. CCUG 60055]MCI3181655.1 sarcosine oxidase subunit delta [Caulobacter sp. CCUG 60055]
MLLIPCPWCGPRDETEFRCGGQSHIQRPEPYGAVGDQAWSDYLFTRANPKGAGRERWVHAFGCRQWFNLVRDTRTHEIAAVYPMGAPPAEIAAETGR